MNLHSKIRLVLFILSAEAAGILGAFFVGNIDARYATLVKPAFSPPNWIFAPVWIALYALMGFAAYLVWQKGGKKELRWYWAQLAVNAIWTPLFFGLKDPTLALFDIVLLLALIAITMWKFARVSRTAALLLVPYLLWVTYATALSFGIWHLN